MTTSFDVRVWDLRKRTRADRPTRFEVRWAVDSREHSRSFEFKAQADAFRAGLIAAAKSGEPFDVDTGQPVGASRGSGPTCYAVAQQMVSAKWKRSAAKSRVTEVDNLAHLLCALVPNNRTAPDGLRLALRSSLGRADAELTPEQKDNLRWLERASLPIADVDDSTVRRALEAVSTTQDGRALSDSVRKQRRTYLSGLFTYAVEQKLVSANPVAQVRIKKEDRAGTIQQVNTRQIGDLVTAKAAIKAIKGALERDFATTVLMAGMRPSEVAALRVEDCTLPAKGWGQLVLAKSSAAAGRAWTDSGEVRDSRGLKHRKAGERRTVPIPPDLVAVLRSRIGGRTRGWVFESRPSEQISDVSVSRAWRDARVRTSLPEDVLPRVYDLRHLAASLWLNAGVPVVEVAARLGHSPEVCLRVYAHVLHSERDRWNGVIESALGGD